MKSLVNELAPNSTNKLDPVDYAVISQGLIAAAREMGVKLVRSAYSTVIREAADASACLFGRAGRINSDATWADVRDFSGLRRTLSC